MLWGPQSKADSQPSKSSGSWREMRYKHKDIVKAYQRQSQSGAEDKVTGEPGGRGGNVDGEISSWKRGNLNLSLIAFKIFSLKFVVSKFTMVFFAFSLLCICWNSWIYGFIVYTKFGKIQLLFLQIFLLSSSLLFDPKNFSSHIKWTLITC